MSEKDSVTLVLDKYQDRERLATIGRLYKEGAITEDEFLNLIEGDRNYLATATLEKIRKSIQEEIARWSTSNFPVQYPYWTGTPGSSPYTVTYCGTSTAGLSNGVNL